MLKRFGSYLFIALFVFAGPSFAQQVGIFDTQTDVGEPDNFGYADFDDGLYMIEGVGPTVGNETLSDQFFFVSKEMSGSFAIEAYPEPIDAGVGGLMVRQSLDADAPHVSILMNTSYASYPHIRTIKGGGTIFDGDPEPAEQVKLRLERLGNSVHIYTIDAAGAATLLQSETGLFDETVLVGIAATAGSADGISLFEFSEVVLEEFPLNVLRDVPTDELQPNASLTGITVTAKVMDGETVDATVREVIPPRSSISNITVSAGEMVDNGDGTVDWTLTELSGEAVMTYDLILGSDDTSAVWRGTFNDGVRPESYIGADIMIPKAPTFTPKGPFDIDTHFLTIIQAEWATPTEMALNEDFGLFFDPTADNGIAVIAIDEPNAEALLQYTLNIPEDGTYYLFGNAREEDGNSDSMHVDMDNIPVGDDTSRWNLAADKTYEVQWVSQESPLNDPRPFVLTAGEHVFNIMSREDSASVDWLGVTSNASLDLANLDLNARAIVSRVISDDYLEISENSVSVELKLFLKAGVTDSAIVTEIPPINFGIENVSANAGTVTQNADGSITWDMTGVSDTKGSLTYTIAIPEERNNYVTGGFFQGSFVLGSDAPVEFGDTIAVLGAPVDPIGKTVYFFGNIDVEELGDRIFISEMRTLFGLDVILYDDSNNAGLDDMPADLSGSDMTFISGSVGSTNMVDMNYHINDETPIVFNESYIADDYVFQPGTNGGASGTEIEIVDNDHPIMDGFELGLLQVFNETSGMGGIDNPPEGLRVLAIEPGNPDVALLYIFEKGASANGSSTPGDRISIFYGGGSLIDMTAAGRKLHNQIFAYSLGIEAPDVGVHDFMLY